MLKMGLFAAAAVLTLVSASPPDQYPAGPGGGVRSPLGDESRALDPADDDDGPGPSQASTTTVPTDTVDAADYPPCTAVLRDRCQQGGGHYAARPSRRAYAMAGERG
jgi:hypothetical protein